MLVFILLHDGVILIYDYYRRRGFKIKCSKLGWQEDTDHFFPFNLYVSVTCFFVRTVLAVQNGH